MAQPTTYRNALPLGTMLQEYRLDAVLGAGAFGMTYLCWDTHLEKNVAIKEYLPVECALRALDGSVVPITTDRQNDYEWGLDRFLMEARTLAKFSHPNIVRVNRYFSTNGTAYVVMDYEDGEPLSKMLKDQPHLDEAQLLKITLPLLDGLQAVHAAGFLHRDIKPANVFIRKNGTPVLLDFGAARQALSGATKTLTSVLTPGYAPLEQYSSDGNQGPWTDIYALGGVLYRAVMNENPPEVTSRIRNDMVSARLRAMRGRVGVGLLSAIDWALTLDEKQRPQTVTQWRDVIERGALPSSAAPQAANASAAFPATVRIASQAQPPSRPATSHPAAPVQTAARVRSTPPPNAMAYPPAHAVPARAGVAAPPSSTGVSPRKPADGVVVGRPRSSLHVGWLVLLAMTIGAAVWIGRSRSQAAPEQSAQRQRVERIAAPAATNGHAPLAAAPDATAATSGKSPSTTTAEAAVAAAPSGPPDAGGPTAIASASSQAAAPSPTRTQSPEADAKSAQVTDVPAPPIETPIAKPDAPAQHSEDARAFDVQRQLEAAIAAINEQAHVPPPPSRHTGHVTSYEARRAFDRFEPDPRGAEFNARRPRAPGPGRGFLDADHNRDGTLTRDEAQRFPTLARRFEQFDANGDGRISPREFDRNRHLLPPPPERFAR